MAKWRLGQAISLFICSCEAVCKPLKQDNRSGKPHVIRKSLEEKTSIQGLFKERHFCRCRLWKRFRFSTPASKRLRNLPAFLRKNSLASVLCAVRGSPIPRRAARGTRSYGVSMQRMLPHLHCRMKSVVVGATRMVDWVGRVDGADATSGLSISSISSLP